MVLLLFSFFLIELVDGVADMILRAVHTYIILQSVSCCFKCQHLVILIDFTFKADVLGPIVKRFRFFLARVWM